MYLKCDLLFHALCILVLWPTCPDIATCRLFRSLHVNAPPLRWFHNILAHPVQRAAHRQATVRASAPQLSSANVKIVCGSCRRSCVASGNAATQDRRCRMQTITSGRGGLTGPGASAHTRRLLFWHTQNRQNSKNDNWNMRRSANLWVSLSDSPEDLGCWALVPGPWHCGLCHASSSGGRTGAAGGTTGRCCFKAAADVSSVAVCCLIFLQLPYLLLKPARMLPGLLLTYHWAVRVLAPSTGTSLHSVTCLRIMSRPVGQERVQSSPDCSGHRLCCGSYILACIWNAIHLWQSLPRHRAASYTVCSVPGWAYVVFHLSA